MQRYMLDHNKPKKNVQIRGKLILRWLKTQTRTMDDSHSLTDVNDSYKYPSMLMSMGEAHIIYYI